MMLLSPRRHFRSEKPISHRVERHAVYLDPPMCPAAASAEPSEFARDNLPADPALNLVGDQRAAALHLVAVGGPVALENQTGDFLHSSHRHLSCVSPAGAVMRRRRSRHALIRRLSSAAASSQSAVTAVH